MLSLVCKPASHSKLIAVEQNHIVAVMKALLNENAANSPSPDHYLTILRGNSSGPLSKWRKVHTPGAFFSLHGTCMDQSQEQTILRYQPLEGNRRDLGAISGR